MIFSLLTLSVQDERQVAECLNRSAFGGTIISGTIG